MKDCTRKAQGIRKKQLNNRVLIKKLMLVIILAAIFILDTLSELEIAAAVFYVVVILLAVRYLPSPRAVILLTGVCVVLTIASFFLTRSGAFEAGLINCIISLMALILTTYIALRMQEAEKQANQANAQLTRVARIQSLGELTATIAHEINQPLAAAVASADACRNWLLRDTPDLERAKKALERIQCETKRASDVVTRIRSISKNEAPNKQVIDLNVIVGEILALSTTLIDRNEIHFEWVKYPEPLSIKADKVQIMQVVSNLLLNAIDALKERPDDNRFMTLTTGHNDEQVILTLTDTGTGIKNKDLNHIFDAFWTTRKGGTGLGLTLCRAIIEAHEGILRAEHNPHGGTTMRITLPKTENIGRHS